MSKCKRIIKVGIISAICVAVIGALVFAITTISAPAPVKTVKQFLQHMQDGDFFEMSRVSADDIDSLIDDFVGININGYKLVSCSDETIVKHTIHKYSASDSFDADKILYLTLYPDYDVLIDTDTEFMIQSKEAILKEYVVVMNVSYSNIVGDQKQNDVMFTITQKAPDKSEYVVSDVLGFFKYL